MQAALSASTIRLCLHVVLEKMRIWIQNADLSFAAGQLRWSQHTDALRVHVIMQEIGLGNGAIC